VIKPDPSGTLLPVLVFAGLLASLAPSGLLAAPRTAAAARPHAPRAPITIAVDATEAPRQVFHAHIVIPAGPGPLTLYYPKWIPGEHGPNGPLAEVAGLKLQVDGAPLAWHRDPVDMYAFHVTLPAGARSLAADLDFLSPNGEGVYTAGRGTTAELALLSWNSVMLYPQGTPTDDLPVTASLRLPAGWKLATALPIARQGGETVDFAPVSLTTLVDSPVLLGAHMRTVTLGGGAPVHQIDMAADTEGALEVPADFAPLYEKLVAETQAFFGGHHYRDYHWLLTLSDHTAHFGLEHHESSDDRTDEKSLLKEELRRGLAGLLSHEYAHSWNGKYRRPADLMSPDLHTPMQGGLLWVYEGLTQYAATVLPPRSSLWTPEYTRERIAQIAASLDYQPGRTWRPLADTAVAAQTLGGLPSEWGSWRRGADYYDESVLIWLEADAILRQKSNGKASMDDFCHRFHGGLGGPEVKTYTFEDVVATLNAVAPYDWKGFLTARLEATDPHAPLGGLSASGWKLVYTEVPNEAIKDREERGKSTDWSYSLGLQVKEEDGVIRDVIPGTPAYKAGIGPGMKLLAVNGRAWKKEWVDAALRAAKAGKAPIELLVENSDYYKTYSLDYHDGPRYPHLERDPAHPDLLGQNIAPHAAPPAAPARPAGK
jgi:predicted metalloprotease with PDZ domain